MNQVLTADSATGQKNLD